MTTKDYNATYSYFYKLSKNSWFTSHRTVIDWSQVVPTNLSNYFTFFTSPPLTLPLSYFFVIGHFYVKTNQKQYFKMNTILLLKFVRKFGTSNLTSLASYIQYAIYHHAHDLILLISVPYSQYKIPSLNR